MKNFANALRQSLVPALLLTATCASQAQTVSAPYTTGYRYDASQRLIATIQPSATGTSGPFLASRRIFNAQGLLDHEDRGSLAAWQSDAIPLASWTGFTVAETTFYTYDTSGRKLTEGLQSGSTYTLTQYGYDSQNNLQCVAQRMNPAAFGSLPSACVLGPAGTQGQDRITYTTFDALGRPLQIQKAYGTSVAYTYATYSYYAGGPLQSVTDADGNYTYYTYDGYVQLQYQYFPAPSTKGSYNSTDYEQYGYDNNGNRKSLRKRDAKIISFDYDGLNRELDEIYPSGTIANVYFGYDLRNLQLYARFGSGTGAGLTQTYDGFGRLSTASTNLSGSTLTLSYQYDLEVNRTRVTHPDTNYFQYAYDGLNRLSTIRENGGTTVITQTYDGTGRRWTLQRGANVSSSTYTYDGISRLQGLAQDLQGTSYDESRTFGYNPASQVTTRTLSNAIYTFTQVPSIATGYQVNGLNQYTLLTTPGTSASPGYDANGNMTSDGATTFGYDVLNRMTSATGAKTVSLSYDPNGRLFQSSGGGSGTTQFLYDGDELAAEYDGLGVMRRRYVHGTAIDEPLISYEGASVGATNRRYLHADNQGSVVAIADVNGNELQVNTYDPYGVPAPGNLTGFPNRFQYTGQIMLPDLGQYYYKARIYNPTIGRFMQTDPIGYRDDINDYSYVGQDPVNHSDPTGTEAVTCTFDEISGKGSCEHKDDGSNDLTLTTSTTNKEGKTTTLTKTYSAADVLKVGSVSAFVSAQYRYGLGVAAKDSNPDYSVISTASAWWGFGSLPGNGPNSAGSTGRQPQNLKEQEAMREAQSNPQAGQPGGTKPLGDTRWPASAGWVKMRQNINDVEVHYNYNTRTGATDDWKIK